jgi:hypothetical protein
MRQPGPRLVYAERAWLAKQGARWWDAVIVVNLAVALPADPRRETGREGFSDMRAGDVGTAGASEPDRMPHKRGGGGG